MLSLCYRRGTWTRKHIPDTFLRTGSAAFCECFTLQSHAGSTGAQQLDHYDFQLNSSYEPPQLVLRMSTFSVLYR